MEVVKRRTVLGSRSPMIRHHGLTIVKGMAELARTEILEIDEILFPGGLIQPKLVHETFGILRGHGGVHHARDRIPRCQAETGERGPSGSQKR